MRGTSDTVTDRHSRTRRAVLATLGSVAATPVAGCTSDPETATDTEPDSLQIPETTHTRFGSERSTSRDSPTCAFESVEPERGSGTATLWVDRTPAELQLLAGTKAIFESRYEPTLAYDDVPGGTFQAKLQSAVPAGEGPHLFEWAHDLAGSYWESGLLSDQREALRVDPCQYVDTAWDAANWNSHTIGLPVAAETVALLYNKEYVETPPETLGEMEATMAAYHDPENGQFGLGYTINPYFVSGFAQAYGGEIYDTENDELGLTDDALIKGLSVVYDDLRPYMPRDPARSTQAAVFTQGNAPFTIDGPWQLPGYDSTDFEVGVTTLPSLPEGGQPRPYVGVALLYFTSEMAEQTPESVAAREFAEWYTTNPRRILNLANNGGFVPVHDQIAGHPELPSRVRGFTQQVAAGYPMPASPRMAQVWSPFRDALVRAFNADSPDLDGLMASAERQIRANWAESA